MITHERLLQVLSYDRETGLFLKDGKPFGSPNGNGYIRLRIDGFLCYGHNIAWFYVHGQWPKNRLDHRDLCRSNNKIKNLREATKSQNQANIGVRRDSRSRLKGAFPHTDGKNWYSKIRVNGRQIYLGYFSSAAAAHAAYVEAAEKYFGEFARAS